jgi:hypothetical protein
MPTPTQPPYLQAATARIRAGRGAPRDNDTEDRVSLQVTTHLFQSLRIMLAWGELSAPRETSGDQAEETEGEQALQITPVLLSQLGNDVELCVDELGSRHSALSYSVEVTLTFVAGSGVQTRWRHHAENVSPAGRGRPWRARAAFREGLPTTTAHEA